MDFLGQMLDRALGRANLLERRRPSLFEPGSLGEQSITGVEEPSEQQILPETQPGTRRARHEPVPLDESQESAVKQPTVRHVATEDRKSVAQQPVREQVAPPTTPAPSPIPALSPSFAPADPPMSVHESVVERHTQHVTTLRERIIEQRTREVIQPPMPPATSTEIRVSDRASTDAVERPSAKGRQTPVAQAAERATPGYIPSSPAVVPTRQIPLKPALPAKTTATVPPPIHVTIGRVEVRASSATAPTQRARQQSPRMSLDQYLQGRRKEIR